MTYVVVGAGLAGGTVVTQLRENGYEGPVVLFGEEHHLPYERPPLSKGYLMDKDPIDDAFVKPPDWYDDNDIDLRLGAPVAGVDLQRKVVRTGEGEQPYDKLVLATGARPRRLPMADESGAEVAYLRTIEDSNRLKEAFADGRRLAVIGGGWIGLEVAAAAREAGCAVTVVETQPLPLVGVLGPEVAETFANLHRDHGVDLRLNSQVSAVDREGLVLGDGSRVEASLVLVGIGAIPNTEIAEAAGLAVDNGVLVDEQLRTSDADVLAIGDIANHQHPRLGRRIRVEHWDTAIEQGKAAARSLLGEAADYDRLPYFFTDQYDLGMEYVGHSAGYDRVVVRGDVEKLSFTAHWLKDDMVVAGMHVNQWDEIDPIRDSVGKPFQG